MKTESRRLFDTVICNDYCIGCGACAIVEGSPFEMILNQYGMIVAKPKSNIDDSLAKVLDICPFSELAKNEDEISREIFISNQKSDSKIGSYLNCYAGFVEEDFFREKGSSGGIAKWLGYKLLECEMIDHFIQVEPNFENVSEKPLFKYKVFSNKESVIEGSKSSYYPVCLEEVVDYVRKNDGRYAITGVPCFIKALRLMSFRYDVLKDRLKFCVGIICGGMKSANQSKMIGWQLGVEPPLLKRIDFRRKSVNKSARNKIYEVWSTQDNEVRYRDSYEIYGTDFGAGYFKPKACDYCDDVVAETADVSCGDAWLPDFVDDPKGNTLLIVRNQFILQLIEQERKLNNLSLVDISSKDVIKAQLGGFRHRHEALSYRLQKMKNKDLWHPTKRIVAGQYQISRKRKRIYSLRERIAKESHVAFNKAIEENRLELFYEEMRPLYNKYISANYGSKVVRGIRKLKRRIIANICL